MSDDRRSIVQRFAELAEEIRKESGNTVLQVDLKWEVVKFGECPRVVDARVEITGSLPET